MESFGLLYVALAFVGLLSVALDGFECFELLRVVVVALCCFGLPWAALGCCGCFRLLSVDLQMMPTCSPKGAKTMFKCCADDFQMMSE